MNSTNLRWTRDAYTGYWSAEATEFRAECRRMVEAGRPVWSVTTWTFGLLQGFTTRRTLAEAKAEAQQAADVLAEVMPA